MFESVQNFFEGAKSFFGRGFEWISDKASSLGDYIVSGAKSLLSVPKDVVTTVYNDGKSALNAINEDVNKVLDRGSKTIDNIVNKGAEVIQTGQKEIGGTVSNLGQSLSTPLVVGGGIFLALMLLKK